MDKFNKKEYDIIFNKKYRAKFQTSMPRKERDEIYKFLEQNNIKKVEFIRESYNNLKLNKK